MEKQELLKSFGIEGENFIWDFETSPHLVPVYIFWEILLKKYSLDLKKDGLLVRLDPFSSVGAKNPDFDTLICKCTTIPLPENYFSWFCLKKLWETATVLEYHIGKDFPWTSAGISKSSAVALSFGYYAGDIQDRTDEINIIINTKCLEVAKTVVNMSSEIEGKAKELLMTKEKTLSNPN